MSVTKALRTPCPFQDAAVVWLTGLPGAGKSTLASAIERALGRRGVMAHILDGDALRAGLNSDLGFSREDRIEAGRRAAEVARLFATRGRVVIVALVSPTRHIRSLARRIIQRQDGGTGVRFIEVFVDTPLEVCEARDPKGLYRKARQGEVRMFTGVSDGFEVPSQADFVVRTTNESPQAAAQRLIALLAATGSAGVWDRPTGPLRA